MTSRHFAIAAVLLLFHPRLAAPQELSAREIKKISRQADKAWAAGQGERAAELYGRVLASTPPGDGRRADALYAVAMALLSPQGPARDVEAAGRHLEELEASFPRHPRRLEIQAVRTLLAELGEARADIARRDGEAEQQLAALEAERQAMEKESEASGGRVKSLEARLRRARAELAETRSELEKKEEALQKLRDALVSRAGG